jgi:hypothetical protein
VDAAADRGGRSGIGGWLAVLCVWLVAWQPLQVALLASSVLDRLPIRGASLLWVLALRLLVGAIGIAAGLALVARRASAVALAKISLAASAAADTFVYATRYLPSPRVPGHEPFFVGIALAYYCAWFAYLVRSTRVRNTFSI